MAWEGEEMAVNGNGVALAQPTRRKKTLFRGLPNVQVFQNGAGTRSEIFRVRVPEKRVYIIATGMVPIMRFVDTDGNSLSHTARLAWGVFKAEEDFFPLEIAQMDYAYHAELEVRDQLIRDNQDSLRLIVHDLEGRERGAVRVAERQLITVSIEAPTEIDWDNPDTVFRFEVLEEAV